MAFTKNKRVISILGAGFQALLGIWAVAIPTAWGQQQGSERFRVQQQRNLSNIAVIGMLTGNSQHTNTHIRINDTDYIISPTGNSKPFTVSNFSRTWIEIKLKGEGTENEVSRIAYRYFDSERSLYQALLLNQVDFAILSDEALARDVNKNNSNMSPAPIAKKTHSIELIIYNLKHDVLKNVEVRKAISYSIRRKDLIEQVIDGVALERGEIAKGSVYEPDHELYPDVGIDEYRHNLRKARELLEGAGWHDKNNDGVREKNGKKLKINLAYKGGIALEEIIARDILLACNRLGIEITGVALSDEKIQESLAAQQYEAVLWEHTFDENIDAVYDFFTNPKKSFIRFSNESYNRFYNLAKQSSDRKRIIALAQGMQAALNKQCVVSFLFFKWYDYAIINAAKIDNVRDLSSGQINPVNKWRFKQANE